MTPKVAHRWTPITDLTAEDVAARSRELPPLAEVWKEQRQRLGDDRALETFNERLHREWAIETGVIERLYTLDRGITQLLIERGVDASLIPHDATDKPPELVAGIIRDQQSAVDWLFDVVAVGRELSTSFIKELHALMARKQETATGLDPFGREVEVTLVAVSTSGGPTTRCGQTAPFTSTARQSRSPLRWIGSWSCTEGT